jgi:hypothetical protein
MANLSNINNILRTDSLGVGINRDPLGVLEVSSATRSGIKMFNTGASGRTYETYVDASGNYIIYDEDASRNDLVISSGGNVGIGTDSPGAKLEISDTNKAINTPGNLFVSTTDTLAVDKGGQISLGGVWSGTSKIQFAGIAGRKENATSGNAGGYLQLSTTNSSGGALTERMRISSGGNVGIGTTSPNNAKLVISSTDSNKISIDGGSSQNGMRWEAVAGANGFYLFNGTYGTAGFGLYNINTNSSPLWIQNGGNVGIGTTSPSSLLHVKGTDSVNITTRFEVYNAESKFYLSSASSGDGGYYYNSSNNTSGMFSYGDYTFNVGTANISGTVGNPRMVIQQGGNVGIGVTSPTANLDIAGNVGIGTTSPSQKLEVSGALVVGMTTPSPFWNALFKDYSDGSGVYISSVNGGGGKYIAGNAYYYNSTLWRSDKTVASAINLDNGTVVFYTNSGLTANTDFTPTERMRITSAGNVGIGTTSPTSRLELAGYYVASSISNVGANSLFTLDTTVNTGINLKAGITSSYNAYIQGYNSQNVSSISLVLNPFGGNVGIGMTSPTTKLEIFGNNSARNTLQNILSINGGTSSNNVYSGFGMGLNFNGRDYSNQPRDYAYIYGVQETSSTSTPGGDPGFTSQLTFYTNTGGAVNTLPTQKMVITAAGNVGIGTTGPQYRLDVLGTSNQQDVLRLQSAWSGVGDYVGMGMGDGWIRNYVENASKDYRAFAFAPRGTERMRIEAGGNVGIGTTSPDMKLDVAGNIRARVAGNVAGGFYLAEGNTSEAFALLTNGANGYFKIRDEYNNSDRLYIKNTGEVGIGTTSPSQKLDVQGNVNINGTVVEEGSGNNKTYRIQELKAEIEILKNK